MKEDLPASYPTLLEELKTRVKTAKLKAALSVNRELLRLYWNIGRALVIKQQTEGWGTKVVDQLGTDLQAAFPGLAGFSRANIYRIRLFFLAYSSEPQIVAQAVRQLTPMSDSHDEEALPTEVADLPWAHHVTLLEKLKENVARRWYAAEALANGWSRAVLMMQIESKLYERQGKAVSNFQKTLPPAQSELAQQTLKDPYLFDFLTLSKNALEHEAEKGLVAHIEKFLLELGAGFAFVGRQYHLEVGTKDFYVDLLFYHLKLRCFVVIDLKTVEFEPEFAGKMNFYLSAVDSVLKHPDDKPSIGLLLCKGKEKTVVEYALRDIQKLIGVAQWETKLVDSLPENLKGDLPSVEDLETELAQLPTKE